MVSRVALPLLVAGALVAPAAAQPGPAPAPSCRVNLVRVPADVRAEIEGWVSAEPRCRVALDVRVIPIPEGLYVMATEPSGRMRERTVPDATTAGVLIASWAADDGAPDAAPEATAPVAPAALAPPGASPVAPAPSNGAETDTGPGAAGATEADDRVDDRLATIGFATNLSEKRGFDDAGVRVGVDLWRLTRRFKLGISGALRRVGEPAENVSSMEDVMLGGYVAVDFAPGRTLSVRGIAGLAAMITSGDYMVATSASVILGPTAELTLMVGYGLTRHLELQGGAVVTMMDQDITTPESSVLYRREVLGEIFLGVGFRR